jgi:hypothetical protein
MFAKRIPSSVFVAVTMPEIAFGSSVHKTRQWPSPFGFVNDWQKDEQELEITRPLRIRASSRLFPLMPGI